MRLAHVLKAMAVVVNTIVVAPIVAVVSLFERDAKPGYRVAQLWVWLNVKIARVRITTTGLENLDRSRSYVFVSNHRSNADIVAVAWSLWDYQLRWVAKKELLRVPLFGWGLRALQNIIIDRSDHEGAVESYRRARERISRGISVMVFPEGTRGTGDELLPFKKGGFVLALETATPVVPIAILGTARVLAKKGWKLDAGDVEVRIGRPIETRGRSVADRNALIEEVRAAIQDLMRMPPPAIEHRPALGRAWAP